MLIRVLAGKSEGTRLENRVVGGRMMLQYIVKEIVGEGVGWIDLAQDADK